MATHDYIISNASGAAVRADLNNALAAIATNNSSATEPTTTYAYQWWADTGSSPTVMKLRNAANSGWITLFQLDGEWTVVPFENGTAAAPSIYFKDSGTDTGIYSPGTDQVAISTGGSQRLLIDSYGIVTPGGGVFSGGVSSYAVNGLVLNFSSPFSEIRACRAGGNYGGLKFYTQGANSSGAQAERMTITTEGLVGIGSTAPQNPLVVSNGGANGFEISSATNSGTTSYLLSYNRSTSAYTDLRFDASAFRFEVSASEKARIDSSGRLLVGTSTARSNFYNSTITAAAQIEGTTGDTASLAIIADRSGAPSRLILAASGGSTIGSNTVVASGNAAGSISFQASDGTEFVQLAEITADVDGTPGANDMPGRLVFSTTADGASSPTERMRIDSQGRVNIGTIGTVPTGIGLNLYSTSTADDAGAFSCGNANTTAAACVASFYTATNSTATSNVLIKFGINNYASGSGQINANGASAAAFGTFSDARLKENIEDLPSQWDNIKSLRPVEFDYVESFGGGHQIGFIAQEMQTVYPDAVGIGQDEMLTVTAWSKTEARLVKALQEALERIESLEAEVTALKAS